MVAIFSHISYIVAWKEKRDLSKVLKMQEVQSMKRLVKFILCILLVLVLVVAGYVIYALLAYHRLEDRLELTVENEETLPAASVGETYTILSYNVGFGAYSADYSFFMDGGTESRAYSQEAVQQNLEGVAGVLKQVDPDFALLQEVDTDSTRSYHVDEASLLRQALPDRASVFAQNYDSPYLFWPLTEPHGKSRSGLLTLSRYGVDSALRRSLPVESGLRKFLDLDRCYAVLRLPLDNGKTLCLYNIHLSAYTADGTIATEQLQQLFADMQSEYAAGNYVVCGGDFNKDLLGDSSAVFGVSGEDYTWAQSFPEELIPEGFSLEAPLNADSPVPSCRNADKPYDPQTAFVLTVDGFLVSDNVSVVQTGVQDTGFAWSDHNPVWMTFVLQP